MKVIFIICLFILGSSNVQIAQAQMKSKKKKDSILERLSQTPLSMTIDTIAESARDNRERVAGATLYFYPTFNYKLTPQDNLGLLAEMRVKEVHDQPSTNKFKLLQFKYKRELIKQDPEVASMSAEIRPTLTVSAADRASLNRHGYLQSRVNFVRKVTERLTLSTTFRHYLYARKTGRKLFSSDKGTVYLWQLKNNPGAYSNVKPIKIVKKEWRFYANGAFNVTDRIGLGILGIYINSRNDYRETSSAWVLWPNASYQIDDIFSVTFGVEGTISEKAPGSTMKLTRHLEDQLLYSVTLSSAIF